MSEEDVHIRALLEIAVIEAGLEDWKRLKELDECVARTKSWESNTKRPATPSASATSP